MSASIPLATALYAYRDIHRRDPAPPLPGAPSAAAETDLAEHGERGMATIGSIRYVAGSTTDGSTLVELELTVQSRSLAGTPVRTRTRVPVWITDRLARGTTVPVTVSPRNPGNLHFEWDGAVVGRP